MAVLRRRLLSISCALVSLLLGARADGIEQKVRLIIDTDMSTEVGDALALCTAHKLADMGQAEIAGVMHNTGLTAGVGAIATLNAYYGRPNIPLGAYKGDFLNPHSENASRWLSAFGAGPYVERMAQDFPVYIRDSTQVPEAVEVYRRILAEAKDTSIVIASIGFLGNLAALLESKADNYSPLSGADLVALKVRELVVMGGRYPNSKVMHYQWNFGGGCQWGSPQCTHTPAWAKAVVEGWPKLVPMTFSGYELGVNVLTGSKLSTCVSDRNPCRFAMDLFAKADRRVPPAPSWDPLTILYAVLGMERWGERHRGGINSVNGSDGSNQWVDGALTHMSYLTILPGKQKELAAEIDKLLCSPPAIVV